MMPLSTKLSISGAALLTTVAQLPIELTVAQSTCRWSFSSGCKTNPKSATYNVVFEVDRVSSNANIDAFPVTTIFHWGAANTTITDTYGPGKTNRISDTYLYDTNGFYTTGFSLTFGDGAAGCSGKTITDLYTLELGTSVCNFDGVTSPPTPAPTTVETQEPTEVPSKNPITLFPTVKPTFGPSPQPTNPPTVIVEPVTTTTTTVATTTVAAVTTTTSTETSTTTTTTTAPDDNVSPTTTTTGTTSSTTTIETSPQRQVVPSTMTLFNVGELDVTALSKWETKTIQQIMKHSDSKDFTVTLSEVSQFATRRRRRNLRQLQEEGQQQQQLYSRILADGNAADATALTITFDAVLETESNNNNGFLTEQDASDIVVAGFSTSARQTEYIYSLKSADSATFGNIDRMNMVVNGQKVVTRGIKPDAGGDGDGDDGGSSNMGIIIGGAAGGGALVLFILIGSIFYTKRRKQIQPKKAGSPLKDIKATTVGDDIMGKEWSMQNVPESPDEKTCSSPYLGTIESREGEDDVSTLGDPYFGEAIDARDTSTVAESMVSSDMLALGVKRRGVGSSSASRMDATTATGYTSALGSTYPMMTFADDTTLDDAYQTPDAIGYEEEEDEDYERITIIAPPGKLGIVIDNPSGNIPFVHAIKETSVLHGQVHVGDLVLAVDEADCRGMHSMSVSRLISKRSGSARTLKLLRNSSC